MGRKSSHKKTSQNPACVFYQKNLCKNGEACHFSHEGAPQQQKQLCKYFLVNGCQNDPCYFSHQTSDFPC